VPPMVASLLGSKRRRRGCEVIAPTLHRWEGPTPDAPTAGARAEERALRKKRENRRSD